MNFGLLQVSQFRDGQKIWASENPIPWSNKWDLLECCIREPVYVNLPECCIRQACQNIFLNYFADISWWKYDCKKAWELLKTSYAFQQYQSCFYRGWTKCQFCFEMLSQFFISHSRTMWNWIYVFTLSYADYFS